MVKKFLLDTNIMIELCNNEEGIKEFLKDINLDECEISSINTAEFYNGIFRAKNKVVQEKWYANFIKIGQMNVLPFDEDTSKLFAQIQVKLSKKGLTRPLMDLMIASISMEHDLTLVTKNIKDFQMIEGLKIYKA